MVSVDDVKDYLNIPYDDQDTMIEGMIQNGYDYLENAIDDFEELYAGNEVFARQADSFVKFHWMPSQFDEREGMFSASGSPNMNYGARSLLTQLQMYEHTED